MTLVGSEAATNSGAAHAGDKRGHHIVPTGRNTARNIPLVLVITISTLLDLVAMKLGPGVSQDSVTYAYAADTLAETGRLATVGGKALTIFPPGLPLLLGGMRQLGFSMSAAALVVNVTCLALTVLLTYLLGLEVVRSRLIALAVACFVGMSAATITVFSMLWTEPPFVALTMLTLVLSTRMCRDRHVNTSGLLALAMSTSAATTFRFTGVVFMPVVLLATWIAASREGKRVAARKTMAVGLLSSTGIVLVVVRNVLLGAGPAGNRSSHGLPVYGTLLDSVRTVGSYVVPVPWVPIALVVGTLLSVGLVISTVSVVLARDRVALATAAFVVIYWLVLWCSERVTTIDPVDWRLSSPAFPPMAILLAYGGRRIRDWRRGRAVQERRTAIPFTAAMAVPLAAALALSAARASVYAYHSASDGIWYNKTEFTASPLAAALAKPPDGRIIVMNDVSRGYWSTGITEVRQSPLTNRWTSPGQTDAMVVELKVMMAQGRVWEFAFFDDGPGWSLTPNELIARGIKIRRDRTFGDGSVWVPAS